MTKRPLTLLVLVCMVCCLFAACGGEEEAAITVEEAWNLVLEDLGDAAANAETPHVHNGTYENRDCYSFFVTVDGEELVYIVSTTGEILHKGQGSHSH